jgi:AcrR family transcriptional regulator
VTVKRIAEACGITEPAVYRHYKSKEDIYVAVLESLEKRLDFEGVFDELERENDIEQLLRGLAQHIIAFFTENHDIYRLLLYSALRGHGKASRIYNVIRGTYQRFLRDQLDRLYEADLIIKKNNEITSRCFTGMVFDCALAYTMWKGMQGKTYVPPDVIANNVPIYARGLKK